MNSTEIRVGLRVSWYAGSTRHDGVIRRLENDGRSALIEPDGATPETMWPMIDATDLRIPLTGGVFANDESISEWMVQYSAAHAKFAAALASGVLDKIDDTIDVPEEIVRVIKQVIAVLGTEEAIRFFTMLFRR